MKKTLSMLMAMVLVFSMAFAVGGAAKAEDYSLTFTDSCGTEFTLDKPLERIIVLNRQTAEAIKILGADDLVIATGDTTVDNNPYLGYNDLPDMGKTGELNIEAILELHSGYVGNQLP